MHNLSERAPPTLFMVGTVDDLIPVATAEKYRDRMQELGRRCELRLYPGEKHAFYHKAGFLPTLRDTDAFLVSLGYLRGGFVPPENLE
jgi:acetyl esterase/lipase